MSGLLVTLVQTDLSWEDKTSNLEMLDRKISALQEKTHVIILPEMFSTGFSMNPSELAENMNGPTVGWMRNLAIRKKCILTGSIIIEEDGQYFNRLIWKIHEAWSSPSGSRLLRWTVIWGLRPSWDQTSTE